MKFLITRTSLHYDDRPCKEAKQETFQNWDERGLTEDEYNKKFSHFDGLWCSRGTEHKAFKTAKGGDRIARRWDDCKRWVIEIATLDDLLKLFDKYGELVITSEDMGDPEHPVTLPRVEIYDTYRE